MIVNYLQDLLGEHSPATLATAIERYGVWGWDRFGRRRLMKGIDAAHVLDLLADYYRIMSDFTLRAVELEMPVARLIREDEEKADSQFTNVIRNLYPFGWGPDDCPDFDAIRNGQTEIDCPQRRGAETKSRGTLLTIIAALADQGGICYSERGAASRIAKAVEQFGATVSDDTIRSILREIPTAIDRRMK